MKPGRRNRRPPSRQDDATSTAPRPKRGKTGQSADTPSETLQNNQNSRPQLSISRHNNQNRRPQLSISHGPVINIVHEDHEAANQNVRPPVAGLFSSSGTVSTPSAPTSQTSSVQRRPSSGTSSSSSQDFPRTRTQPSNPTPGTSQIVQGGGDRDPEINGTNHNNGAGNNMSSDTLQPQHYNTPIQEIQGPDKIFSVFDPISVHIPSKIKEKIWSGEFLDLGILLKSHRDLAMDYMPLDGDLSIKGGMLTVVNKKSTPLSNIHVWTSAFLIYASVILEKWPNKGLEILKYMQTIRTAAARGCNEGWIRYDEQFRLKKALDPSSSWGKVDMELWVLLVSSTYSGNFPGQKPQYWNNNYNRQGQYDKADYSDSFSRPKSQTGNKYYNPQGQSEKSMPAFSKTNYCRMFNKGRCMFGKQCKFLHKCSKCHGNHPFTWCKSN